MCVYRGSEGQQLESYHGSEDPCVHGAVTRDWTQWTSVPAIGVRPRP